MVLEVTCLSCDLPPQFLPPSSVTFTTLLPPFRTARDHHKLAVVDNQAPVIWRPLKVWPAPSLRSADSLQEASGDVEMEEEEDHMASIHRLVLAGNKPETRTGNPPAATLNLAGQTPSGPQLAPPGPPAQGLSFTDQDSEEVRRLKAQVRQLSQKVKESGSRQEPIPQVADKDTDNDEISTFNLAGSYHAGHHDNATSISPVLLSLFLQLRLPNTPISSWWSTCPAPRVSRPVLSHSLYLEPLVGTRGPAEAMLGRLHDRASFIPVSGLLPVNNGPNLNPGSGKITLTGNLQEGITFDASRESRWSAPTSVFDILEAVHNYCAALALVRPWDYSGLNISR